MATMNYITCCRRPRARVSLRFDFVVVLTDGKSNAKFILRFLAKVAVGVGCSIRFESGQEKRLLRQKKKTKKKNRKNNSNIF